MRQAAHLEKMLMEEGAEIPRIAVLSSFTADFLAPYILVESSNMGYPLKPWIGPFNQFEQQVLEDSSPLWKCSPKAIWVTMTLDDTDPMLAVDFPGIDIDDAVERLDRITNRLLGLTSAIREKTNASILVSNLFPSPRLAGGVFNANDPNGLVYLVQERNRTLALEFSRMIDVHIFDFAGSVMEAGWLSWHDPKLTYMARAGVGPKAQALLANRLVRSTVALLRPAAKCLVVDLDNTIWGGVLGDDGLEGIRLGDEYPGRIHKDLQRAILKLRHEGIILAISSKNDEELVLEVLEKHPEMVLRKNHFAAIYANWNPKPSNLRRIAENLNIGIDSLVFLDDNPVERAQVRAELPEVKVVELPRDPLYFTSTLLNEPWFDRARILAEDQNRAEMYQVEAERKALKENVKDIGDFLRSLDMTATVGTCGISTIDRIHQLINKTNQFNLTTRRHGLEDIRTWSDSEGSDVLWLRLKDQFGDLGLVCVGIIRKIDKKCWEIDTLLMSCRVMGRKAEEAFISFMAEIVMSRGGMYLKGLYLPTPRNHIVKDLYPSMGFSEIEDDGLEGRAYLLNLEEGMPEWPEIIRRKDSTEV